MLEVSIYNFHVYLESWATHWNVSNSSNNSFVSFLLIFNRNSYFSVNSGFCTALLKKWQLNDQKEPPGRRSVKAVLKNFQIFTGKHLCRSLFLIKFIKKRLQHSCSPVNIAKFFREPILKNICERLLLNDGTSLRWIKSWKPPIIAQYYAQPQRIKRLIVLLFLKTPLIVLKRSSH